MAALHTHREGVWSRRGLASGDDLLAVALVLAGAAAAAVAGPASTLLRLVGVLAAGGFLALGVRREHPLGALAVLVPTVLVAQAAAPQAGAFVQFLALLVASYSLGAHEPSRHRLVAGVVVVAGGVTGAVLLGPPSPHSRVSSLALFLPLLVLLPVTAGRLVRARSELISRVREATERLEATQAARVSAAVSGERARLASELEPVVLTGLEAMRKHAEARSLGAVEALERTARQTLTAMRRLLSRFRAPAGSPTPELRLNELRAQVERLLAQGAPSAVSGAGEPTGGKVAGVGGWTLVRSRRIDAALTLLALASSVALALMTASRTGLSGPHALDIALAASIPLPLAAARPWPLASASLGFALVIAYAITTGVTEPLEDATDLAVLPGIAIGASCHQRRALLGLAMCAAGETAALTLDPGSHPSGVDGGLFAALLVAGWAFGRVLHERTRLLQSLTSTGVALEHERRLQALETTAAERARVARDLHDAVAHSLTIVLLQAAAARRVWHTDPTRAQTHISALRSTVAETVGGLRELVVSIALGTSETEPHLDRLVELAALARSAGLHVELTVEPGATTSDRELGRTAYRIVQEALTNAARHAPGAATTIRVRRDGTALVIEADNGSPLHHPVLATPGTGHGLRGMRERAAACGGELEARPREDGGFTVRARLPARP